MQPLIVLAEAPHEAGRGAILGELPDHPKGRSRVFFVARLDLGA